VNGLIGNGSEALAVRTDFAAENGTRAAAVPAQRSQFTSAERESLYRELQPLVKRLIRQYGEDQELQQDLPGEIFYRFSTLLEAYDPTRGVPLRPYLVRALSASVYTFARSHWRRQKREITVETDVEGNEPSQSHDPTASWDRDLMTQEVLKALPAAIEKLPRRQRQVVTGRFYEARSFDDIAQTLGVCPATARSLLRHGLNNLRRHLARTGLAWD
jgi:RNA polymerase sigma factor (sigma-70 family)